MTQLAEGTWPAVAINATYGKDEGKFFVRIKVRFDEGPNEGRIAYYESEIDNKQGPYAARSCRAVGWRGVSPSTLPSDVAAWIRETGGKTTAEVKHIEIRKGKAFDKWVDGGRQGPRPVWDKVTAIGSGQRPLAEPSAAELADAAAAMGGHYDDVPPPDDEDFLR